jgi:hypothetical protein
MRRIVFLAILLSTAKQCFCWGFYAHQKINYYAVFLLPPQMMQFYKPHIQFLSEHAVDPDKRRYAVAEEAPRHYIDIDHYGSYPYTELPRKWQDAANKFGEDTLSKHGILPWWLQTMQLRLTQAFKEKNSARILKLSAELGHYLADAHVPLHASSNHNGQLTNQKGIHAFWESRVPELLAEKEWNFFVGKAVYIPNTADYAWNRILESAAAADSVLRIEKELSISFPADQKFSFEERNGLVVRQYSSAYSVAYNKLLKGMIERRMRQSISAIACFWYTAWVNAGQPDLSKISSKPFSLQDSVEFEQLNARWREVSTGQNPVNSSHHHNHAE